MEVLIKDLCRERKDTLHLTNQDVADQAGISVSTVNNYFSSASKAPSVYTVGPICSALGVSLDKYFGIEGVETPTELSDRLARIADLEQKCRDYEKDLTHKDEIAAMQDNTIKHLQEEVRRRRPLIYCLIGLSALVVIAFIAYLLHYDLTNPNYGIFRG